MNNNFDKKYSLFRRASPDYANLLSNLDKTKLALILQRNYRNKKKSEASRNDASVELPANDSSFEANTAPQTINSNPKMIDTSNDENWVSEIINQYSPREPDGYDYINIAESINNGNWLSLDFADKDFKLHALKALRFGLLTVEQLATAFILADAIDYFKPNIDRGEIEQHKLSDRSSFDLASFHRISQDCVNTFYNSTENLSTAEHVYFSITLSQIQLAAFLIKCINRDFVSRDGEGIYNLAFNTLFSYLNSRNFFNDDKNFKINIPNCDQDDSHMSSDEDHLQCLLKSSKGQKSILKFIEAALPTDIPEFSIEELNKSLDNWLMITEVLKVEINIPGLKSICDNNGNVIGLKFNLLSFPATKLLLFYLYGNQTTQPNFLLGKLSTSTIIDDFLSSNREMRPFELSIPGIIAGESPHGIKCDSFASALHDLFHIYRGSSIKNKSFFRHLASNEQLVRNSYINKVIWYATDLSFKSGIYLDTSDHLKKVYLITYILNVLSSGLMYAPGREDKHFIILVDMVINREIWRDFLGEYPDTFFSTDLKQLYPHLDIFEDFTPDFINALRKTDELRARVLEFSRFSKKLILSDIFNSIHENLNYSTNSKISDAIIYCILLRKLGANSVAVQHCNYWRETGFDRIMRWSKNGDLVLADKTEVSKMVSHVLFDVLATRPGNTTLKFFDKPHKPITSTRQCLPYPEQYKSS